MSIERMSIKDCSYDKSNLGKEEMTKEQLEKLRVIGEQIQKIFPDMYGNVYFRFNLIPGRQECNMNYGVEESKIIPRPYPIE